jgi:hypothetical protein
MTASTILLVAAGAVAVESQDLSLTIDPASHQATVEARLVCAGAGPLRILLTDAAEIDGAALEGRAVTCRRVPGTAGGPGAIHLDLPAGGGVLTIAYRARLHDEVEAGERPGQIHNFAVEAHLGPDGIFLSDGSSWHPRPLDGEGRPALHPITLAVTPMEGWVLVASGEPAERDPTRPCWRWSTPRPADGVALAGNRHRIVGRVHQTAHGPVELVMHAAPDNAALVPLFLDAASAYLDLYTPLLGPFPYRRFTIAENFFSSGFAYPGFTLLGPRVVAMAPRSLAPGYLDHELLHNWWGNGVYVDPGDGNWCEALATFGANYYRRVAEGGAEAGRAWRRGVISMASSDPGRDDGPLGAFGSADPEVPGPDRFVGYDKGAFILAMLGDVLESAGAGSSDAPPAWRALREFASRHMGERANWSDLQRAFEAQVPDRPAGWLDGFFEVWLRQHTVPRTVPGERRLAPREFAAQYAAAGQPVRVEHDPAGAWCEMDPEFRLYRLLPPEQIVPTIQGTFGQGGVRVVVQEEPMPQISAFLAQFEPSDSGENLLLVGAAAVRAHAGLLAQAADPVRIEEAGFTIAGATHGGADRSVLHTMAYPGRPGRCISVFLCNGPAGWSRLTSIRFYTRDTTVIWEGDTVLERRVFEPDRRIALR